MLAWQPSAAIRASSIRHSPAFAEDPEQVSNQQYLQYLLMMDIHKRRTT